MRIKRIIDLSYHLFPEKEQRRLRLIETRSLDTSYSNEFALEMHAHIGTHVEGPYHCLETGKKIDDFPPDKFIGTAAIIDLTQTAEGERRVTKQDLIDAGSHVQAGDIVLLKTGYDDGFPLDQMQSEEYMANSPYLTDDAVNWLIQKKIKLLGIDFWSIEEFPIDPEIGEPRHILLFNKEIPLIHSLVNMRNVTMNRSLFVALPLPISGLDSSPVRAVLIEV